MILTYIITISLYLSYFPSYQKYATAILINKPKKLTELTPYKQINNSLTSNLKKSLNKYYLNKIYIQLFYNFKY